jgi:hypothetical protein
MWCVQTSRQPPALILSTPTPEVEVEVVVVVEVVVEVERAVRMIKKVEMGVAEVARPCS